MKIKVEDDVFEGATYFDLVQNMRDKAGPYHVNDTVEQFSRCLINNLRDYGVEVDPPWEPLEDRCRVIIEASILAGLTERLDPIRCTRCGKVLGEGGASFKMSSFGAFCNDVCAGMVDDRTGEADR